MEDPDQLILNKWARAKAKLIASKAIKELHKSASRIKREVNYLMDTLKVYGDSEELTLLLNQILENVKAHKEEAMKVYQLLLDNHKNTVRVVGEMMHEEIKLIGGSSNG